MCTSIILGRKATADGSVILAANDDWAGCPGRLRHQPATEWEKDDTFLCVRGKRIAQPTHTQAYLYTAAGYPTGTRVDSWIYGVNESQVAVSMQGVYAFRDLGWESDALETDDLPWLILQRAETARGAIEMVGSLIATHGFAPSSIPGAEGTAVLAIADPEEGWWLELVPGGEWVATRVPDDAVSVRVNSFGTHDVDLSDTWGVMTSPGLVERARDHGWLAGPSNARFDFASAYGAGKLIDGFGDERDPTNVRRRWRLMSLAAGHDLPESEPIYQVKPDRTSSVADVMGWLRDTYAGTAYDLSASPAAGPFHNPFHHEPESYSVAGARTVVSTIAQLRSWLPPSVGGLFWVAMDNPCTSVYLPWYVGVREVQKAYTVGTMGSYDETSAWWAFQELSDACYPRFDEAAVKTVIPYWRQMEQRELAVQESIERTAAELCARGDEAGPWLLDAYSNALATKAIEDARRLRMDVKRRYADWATVEN